MSDFSDLPPLNALRGFEAVARHMSFSAAAQELRITSAAVSQQIKNLEDFLGVRCFRPRSWRNDIGRGTSGKLPDGRLVGACREGAPFVRLRLRGRALLIR